MGDLDVPNCSACLNPMQPVVGGWWCASCGEALRAPESPDSLPDFQIPEGIFGYVPPRLPTLIGKVVMLAALLETKIEGLTSSVDNATQDVHGGRGFAVNSTAIKKRLSSYEANPAEQAFSAEVRVLLAEIEDVLEDRNFIVHGVWPKSSDFAWWGWKPRRKSKTSSRLDWIEGRTLTPEEFIETCETLVSLLDRTQRAIEMAGSMSRRP
ncbi:hypothetical protein GCM10022239_08670 [Leifsonia bigeumensis]|uniref:Uncharacterized protein n=1 Tax=Leifsonella bigeumensis TaxID=433643 RepID=A0ABP7FAP7_9MICO